MILPQQRLSSCRTSFRRIPPPTKLFHFWEAAFQMPTARACNTYQTGPSLLVNTHPSPHQSYSPPFAACTIPTLPPLLGLSCFDWAVYGFNSGHFISSIRLLGLPFAIVVASNEYANSRSLFTKLSTCTGPILGGCRALLDHIKASRITSKLSGYLVHSRRYDSTKPTSQFW
jgi:hypothetical protein